MKSITRNSLLIFVIAFALLFSFPVSASSTQTSEASITLTPGIINLNQVSTFSFGTQTIKGRTVDYHAKTIDDSVIVVDARGNMSGWAIQLNLSTFTQNGKETLAGSSLILNLPAPKPIDSYGVPPSKFPSSVELVAGDNINHSLWTAGLGEGSGMWNMAWESKDISLRVPGGRAIPGNNQAVLEWQLVDAP